MNEIKLNKDLLCRQYGFHYAVTLLPSQIITTYSAFAIFLDSIDKAENKLVMR